MKNWKDRSNKTVLLRLHWVQSTFHLPLQVKDYSRILRGQRGGESRCGGGRYEYPECPTYHGICDRCGHRSHVGSSSYGEQL
jgi:hypothetical protein